MRFALTEEQEALAEAARGFLDALPGPESMAEQGDAYDPEVWSRVVEEQGWPAILVPEEAGGWGFGMVEMAVVFQELGRRMTPTPMFGTVGLGVSALRAHGGNKATEVLGAIAEGATATAILGAGVTAQEAGGGFVLSGAAPRVIDGHTADWVVARTPQGWFVVEGERLVRTPCRVLDTTRPLAMVRFDGVEVGADARLDGDQAGVVSRHAALMLAAEQVGGADFMLETAVDYAKVRRQYGQAIGSFQSIQHMCADLLLQLESARSVVQYAAWALDEDAADAARAVRTAKATASDAFFAAAGQGIQIHGGIGFTWEHACHLYFKRARAGMSLLGSPAEHREAVAASLLDGTRDPWEAGAWT
jgi:alkylation response protein AidB-like acyl-CoA dehydrogenase